MRYIINTEDTEGIIGMQIQKWANDKKLTVIEKSQPLIELKEHLERIARALEVLKKAGYNSDVMKSWIYDQTKVSKAEIRAVLKSQEDFFRQIRVLK